VEQRTQSAQRQAGVAARGRRLAMNAIAVALLYGNAAVALQPGPLRNLPLHLPAPVFLVDAFLVTGMFGSYSIVNTDLYIGGLRTNQGSIEDRGRFIELPVREHFALRQGVIFTQLFATHDWDVHGLASQQKAWVVLARKLREHHNRLHPDHRVSRIIFGTVSWPQSPFGYRALKRVPLVRVQTWHIDPEAP
jgi:hypothetical protein